MTPCRKGQVRLLPGILLYIRMCWKIKLYKSQSPTKHKNLFLYSSQKLTQFLRPMPVKDWVLAAQGHGLVWVPLFSRVFFILTSAAAAFQWPV